MRHEITLAIVLYSLIYNIDLRAFVLFLYFSKKYLYATLTKLRLSTFIIGKKDPSFRIFLLMEINQILALLYW